jgi:hypothetical protein
VKKAIEIIFLKSTPRLKSALKILRNGTVSFEDQAKVCELMEAWILGDPINDILFGTLRAFFNFVITTGKPEFFRHIHILLKNFLHNENFCSEPEGRRILKTIFVKVSQDFREPWEIFLEKQNIKISNTFVCELVRECTRKKTTITEKNAWENFQRKFCVPTHTTTETNPQSCTITTRKGQVQTDPENFPSSVVVWNANGVRARWTAPQNEIKNITHAINPDLFCILESKTNAEKLLALQGFEEWVNEAGFTQIFCYWSTNEEKTAHGGEGILIFSKIACKIFYGMREDIFDKQARIITLQFPHIYILISYNPQGGFSEKSLGFRDQWEKAFINFLRNLRKRAEREEELFGPEILM